MQDHLQYERPGALEAITRDTEALGFDMASEPKTGALLKTLAASKPGSRLLELGTGTGLSAAWLLLGMDAHSSLISVDNDPEAQDIAVTHLASDSRLSIVCADGATWLKQNQDKRFDFVFADAWPGKFSHLELALNLLNEGGMYVIDDLLPQESWPEGHAPRVPKLMDAIECMEGFTSVRMSWASGLMLVVKCASR